MDLDFDISNDFFLRIESLLCGQMDIVGRNSALVAEAFG